MKKRTFISILIVFSLLLTLTSVSFASDDHYDDDDHAIKSASDDDHHDDDQAIKSASIKLSKDLGKALSKEMLAIEKNMGVILNAIYAGEWKTIHDAAKKIKESYILKQELSRKQLEELHRVLPKEFIKLDSGFHNTALRLAVSAKEHNAELVNFYFYKMNEACVTCHSIYAKESFPNFGAEKKESHDH